MGNVARPGRDRAAASGVRAMKRGAPSASARAASAITVGRVQLPPTQPWKPPSAVTMAASPTCVEIGASRFTTVARAKGSPRRESVAASCSRS